MPAVERIGGRGEDEDLALAENAAAVPRRQPAPDMIDGAG